jgi:hypothetical protein
MILKIVARFHEGTLSTKGSRKKSDINALLMGRLKRSVRKSKPRVFAADL